MLIKSIRFEKHSAFLLSIVGSFFIVACSGSDGGSDPESFLMEMEQAYRTWPNETTSDLNSSEIVSKVLVTDLDGDNLRENIFISVVPNSSKPWNGVLRITRGPEFSEVYNFKSTRVFLYKQSLPYAYDIDEDGLKELFFVSHQRHKVYSFGVKEEISNVFVRWSGKLPEALSENFNPRFSLVDYEGEKAIRIADYGLVEEDSRNVKVIKLK